MVLNKGIFATPNEKRRIPSQGVGGGLGELCGVVRRSAPAVARTGWRDDDALAPGS